MFTVFSLAQPGAFVLFISEMPPFIPVRHWYLYLAETFPFCQYGAGAQNHRSNFPLSAN
jgi:hypothetical protein